MKYNSCIAIISSRKACLKSCLQSLWQHFNYKHNYPTFIHYFDDIYDSPSFQEEIYRVSTNTYLIKVPYKTPEHIKEEELYYNRTNIKYVKNSFPIARKGYLHMCNFTFNMFGYPNTLLHNYDYIMTHDDESGYLKELPYDPFDIMIKRPEDMGAYIVGQRLKNGKPHQGHFDTRINLWPFTKAFLLNNNIIPKSKLLQDLMTYPTSEYDFHLLPWSDTYIIKTKIFSTDLWKKWSDAVNNSGGIYKYRWGDNELMSLFYMIYNDKPMYNLKTVENGYYDQGMFRKLQSTAPGVKDNEK